MPINLRIPVNIDFKPNPLISSKYTTKVYIQNTVNKEIKTSVNKKEQARSTLVFYISMIIDSK